VVHQYTWQALDRWHKDRAAILAQHEKDALYARAMHEESMQRLQAEWEAKAAEVRTFS